MRRVEILVLLGVVLSLGACGGSSDGGSNPPPTNLSFAADILPIFVADCNRCHGGGGAGGLDLASYQGLLAGGQSGPVVVAGDPGNSLIIQRIDGTVLPAMPLGGPFLPQPEIDRIAQWILEGALDN